MTSGGIPLASGLISHRSGGETGTYALMSEYVRGGGSGTRCQVEQTMNATRSFQLLLRFQCTCSPWRSKESVAACVKRPEW